jgi:hypothetical protein
MFGSHRRQGRNTAELVEQAIKAPFLHREAWPHPRAPFVAPLGLYRDPYVLGFVVSVALHFRDFVYGGAAWSDLKKGEYVAAFLSSLDKGNRDDLLTYFRTRGGTIGPTTEFQCGSQDGATYFAAVQSRLRPDDPDPIAVEARKFNTTSPDVDRNRRLAAEVHNLTIGRHLEGIIRS